MEDTYKNIEEFANEMGLEDLSISPANGLEEAFLGMAERFGAPMVPVFSYDMCIQILMRDNGWSYDEAIDYFHYNILGAFLSDDQPIYLRFSPHIFQRVRTTKISHLKPRFSNEIENCPEDE